MSDSSCSTYVEWDIKNQLDISNKDYQEYVTKKKLIGNRRIFGLNGDYETHVVDLIGCLGL